MDLFFLAILPPEPIREEVRLLKEEMKERFGAKHALKSPAHITLVMPFERNQEEIAFAQEKLIEFAKTEKPFPVQLSGFGSFPPRVIFANPIETDFLEQFFWRMRQFLIRENVFAASEITDEFHPHMTIATRDLDKAAYHQAWEEFSTRAFNAQFDASAITLLRHNGKFWEVKAEFPLGNL